MQFGVFYEHQLPKPWTDDDEFQLLRDALDQVELADRLGFDYAWEVEHHFLDEYSHSSAPEVFLAAAAARTTAHPPRPRHPPGDPELQPSGAHRRGPRHARPDLRRAGRLRHRRGCHPDGAARVRHPGQAEAGDVARGGRADRQHDGARPVSRLLVGVVLAAVPQRDPQASPEAASTDVDRLHEPRDHQGRRPQRARRAGVQLHRPRRSSRRGSTSTTTSSRARSVCRSATRSTPTSRWSPVSRCTRTAARRSAAGRRASSSSATRSTRSSPTISDRAAPTCGASSRAAARRTARSARIADADALGDGYASCIGSPDDARRYLHQMRDVGVDQVIFIQQAGRNRHEDICSSLELFGATVLPEFAADEPERQRRKRDGARSVRRSCARPQAVDAAAGGGGHSDRRRCSGSSTDERHAGLSGSTPRS